MEKEKKQGGKRPNAGRKAFTSETVLIPFAPSELEALASTTFTRTKVIRYAVRKLHGLCLHASVTVNAMTRKRVCNRCGVANPEDFTPLIRHFEPLIE